MEQLTHETGGFFDYLPFESIGNIYSSVNNETVLGYFHVNTIPSRRLYINAHELKDLGIIQYKEFDCPSTTVLFKITNSATGKEEVRFKSVYDAYVEMKKNNLDVVNILGRAKGNSWEWYAVEVVPKLCTDCTINGVSNPPDFWVEYGDTLDIDTERI